MSNWKDVARGFVSDEVFEERFDYPHRSVVQCMAEEILKLRAQVDQLEDSFSKESKLTDGWMNNSLDAVFLVEKFKAKIQELALKTNRAVAAREKLIDFVVGEAATQNLYLWDGNPGMVAIKLENVAKEAEL